MPKKLNVSSNERIDLDDFTRASSTYTAESGAFDRDKLLLARRAAVSVGFRIELSNQATDPGEFTIYNGVAIDRAGCVLHNEDQEGDARTFTLSGANTDFYVEVEYVEADSDVDSRAFWDPSYTGNTPPGREFYLNASTRISEDWQIVTPVSTTVFDEDNDPDTLKIPVAFLQTNGSNQITGITLVNAATLIEEDVVTSETKLRVLDSTVFPDSGAADIVVGNSIVESITFTANDRANGILTLAPALVGSFLAGAIVRETGPTAGFVPEATAAVPSTASDNDLRRGLFKGDAIRGSAIVASKEDSDNRDDLDTRSLKDYIDFLAAQIREMKWGNLRPDVDSTAPPSSFVSTRYFDNAGSISGARSFSVTIGDNTNSWGDLNSSADDLGTIVQQAHDALDPTNGGSIFIKDGSYVWDSTVIVDRPFTLEFATGAVFGTGTYAGSFISVTAGPIKLTNVPDTPAAVIEWEVLTPAAGSIDYDLKDSAMGKLDLSGGGANVLYAENCVFTSSFNNSHSIEIRSADIINHFVRCTFQYLDTLDDNGSVGAGVISGLWSNSHFDNCIFDVAASTGTASRWLDNQPAQPLVNVKFRGCDFKATNDSSARFTRGIDFPSASASTLPTIDGLHFRDCKFSANWFGATTDFSQRSLIWINADNGVRDILIEGCDFSEIAVNGIGGTTAVNPGAIINFTTNGAGDDVEGVLITGNHFGKPNWFVEAVAGHFVHQINIETAFNARGAVQISDNSFYSFWKGVYIGGGRVQLDNNKFQVKGATTVGLGDVIAVEIDDDAERVDLIASNNLIKIESGSTLTTNVQAGFVFGTESDDCKILSSNNRIDITAVAAAYGVYSRGDFAAYDFVSSNDYIKVAQTGANLAEAWCVHLGSLFISPNNTNITGGYFHVDYDGTGNCGAIKSHGEDVQHDDSRCLIDSNTVIVETTAAANIAYGVFVDNPDSPSITNNTFQLDPDISTGACFAVSLDSNQYTIDGNVINVSPSSGFVRPIVAILGGVGIGGRHGRCSISNNRITQDSTGVSCIEIFAIEDLAAAFHVCDNVCFVRNPATPTGSVIDISISTIDSNSESGVISVCNNIIRDDGIMIDNQTSHHIRVDGFTELDTWNCIVNGNLCKSEVNAAFDRSSIAAAIEVTNIAFVQISDNVITGWIFTASTDGPLIRADQCDVVSIQNNVARAGDGIVADEILATNCDDVYVISNQVLPAGTVDTAGSFGTVTITPNQFM